MAELRGMNLSLDEDQMNLCRCGGCQNCLREDRDRLILQIGEIYGTLDSIIHAANVEEAARTWIPVLMEQLRPVVVKRTGDIGPALEETNKLYGTMLEKLANDGKEAANKRVEQQPMTPHPIGCRCIDGKHGTSTGA